MNARKETTSMLGTAPVISGKPPGTSSKKWIQRDHAVTSPSNTREYPLVVQRAQGMVVEDMDGNRYLDFAAGIAVCATGHCHPQVVEAITRQANELIHICGSDFYYPIMVELAEKLGSLAPWKNPSRVYFTNSGTEAIEAAIKLSRYHTSRKYIIAFEGSFHGRTMGSLSLTASKYKQKLRFGPLIPMVTHAQYGSLDDIKNRLFLRHVDPAEVAAIFVEPIQGEGGYNIPPSDFLPGLRQLCDEHGILLVVDEIQAGMGRTGKWWCCSHDEVVPDMICSAKGLASGMPLGALICKEEVMDWVPGAQGSTYGGNPVCCAASLATIKLIEEQYLSNTIQLGDRLDARLKQLEERHHCVSRARGRGLMRAVDITDGKNADPKKRSQLIQLAFQRGLLLLPCGETAIRFTPPLCIEESDLNVGMDLFEDALNEIA